jgi:hypothetical protein
VPNKSDVIKWKPVTLMRVCRKDRKKNKMCSVKKINKIKGGKLIKRKVKYKK